MTCVSRINGSPAGIEKVADALILSETADPSTVDVMITYVPQGDPRLQGGSASYIPDPGSLRGDIYVDDQIIVGDEAERILTAESIKGGVFHVPFSTSYSPHTGSSPIPDSVELATIQVSMGLPSLVEYLVHGVVHED